MGTKTLIIGPAWVGDMVMAQTLFILLKQKQPDLSLHVLAPAWTFSLLNRMPEVNYAIEMPCSHGELGLRKRWQLAKRLRAEQYDNAIVLPNSLKASLIPWLAGIPKRTGWLGEFRFALLNDWRTLDEQQYPLMIERFMALALTNKEPLVKPYPLPKLCVSKETVTKTLRQLGLTLPQSPILALSPGAEFGPSKRWPSRFYTEVAKSVLAKGWQVWLFGSVKDRTITTAIDRETDGACIDVAGRTTLDGTIDLLSQVTGLITNDSGLMHVAAALDKPIIAIYGSTSPHFTPPLSNDAQILKLDLACQPCFKRHCPLQHHQCMEGIPSAKVIAAMDKWGVA